MLGLKTNNQDVNEKSALGCSATGGISFPSENSGALSFRRFARQNVGELGLPVLASRMTGEVFAEAAVSISNQG